MDKKRIAVLAGTWVASNLLWGFVAPGVGIGFGAVVAGVVHVAQPWKSLLFVGELLTAMGLVLGIVRPLLAAKLPQPKTPQATGPNPIAALAGYGERKAAQEQLEAERVAIHEAITTLRHHRYEMSNQETPYPRPDKEAQYQGEWPENRKLLARKSRYDNALRATEEAFQAIWVARRGPWAADRAAKTIDQAVTALHAALPREDE